MVKKMRLQVRNPCEILEMERQVARSSKRNAGQVKAGRQADRTQGISAPGVNETNIAGIYQVGWTTLNNFIRSRGLQ